MSECAAACRLGACLMLKGASDGMMRWSIIQTRLALGALHSPARSPERARDERESVMDGPGRRGNAGGGRCAAGMASKSSERQASSEQRRVQMGPRPKAFGRRPRAQGNRSARASFIELDGCRGWLEWACVRVDRGSGCLCLIGGSGHAPRTKLTDHPSIPTHIHRHAAPSWHDHHQDACPCSCWRCWWCCCWRRPQFRLRGLRWRSMPRGVSV